MDREAAKTRERSQLARAQEQLGVDFNDAELLKISLTHKSFAHESESPEQQFNEKLEFLGDSVLNFVITDYIFNNFSDFEEGDLAKLRSALVNTEVLADRAARIKLGDHLFLGKGAEQTGGRERTSILADCFEAIIGAMFLDRGLDTVKEFLLPQFIDLINETASSSELSDCKTALQETTAQMYGILPEYRIYREEGPVHARVFFAEVVVRNRVLGRGKGKSKKKAEQQAAMEALKIIGEKQCQGTEAMDE